MKRYLLAHEKGIFTAVDRHPVASLMLGQLMVAFLLIASVAAIAFLGGTLVWLAYYVLGMM